MRKLAIVSTHPIQYNAPAFQLLAKKTALKVFYTNGDIALSQFDEGFKKNISWDIPLLEGYDYEFLKNISKKPGTHHFKGIINPTAIRAISEYKPDGIIVYGWANQSHLQILRHFKHKIPVYFRGDSTLLDELSIIKKILKRIFLKWVYKNIDIAFYVGEANKAYYKYYGLKNEQLVYANHAIDNDRFAQDRKTEALVIRKELNINEDEIIILFAGKLQAKKNPELLLTAFLEINAPSVHLLFVGNGDLEDRLKMIVDKSVNPGKVHFMDFQNQTQMPVIYQVCDLFCLPSRGPGETWGLAVNEAMASGKAVLVSNKVGCALDLVNTTNGEVFASDNINELKQKLIALTASKTKLYEMGRNANKYIKDWSFNKQIDAIINYVNR